MSRRRELARRLAALTDIAGILSAMKGLALMETRILRDSLDSQRRIRAGHATAIVADAHQRHAALPNLDRDRARLRVDGIFDQLFDDRGRSLDHFTRGDTFGDGFGEDVNGR